jgi:hypothetical protein
MKTTDRGKSRRGLYGDVVEEIDWSVGRLMTTLKELKIEGNTLLMFSSDNGPWLHFHTHGGSPGPLRGGKGTTFEGGQRSPTLFWWPGRVPPGSVVSDLGCLDLANIKRLLDPESAYTEKEELSQILRMLVGLRKSWASTAHVVREGSAEYSTQGKGIDEARHKDSGEGIDEARDKARDKDFGERVLFHHETLDVYRVAIKAAEALCSSESASRLPNPVFRRLDELLTSMVLNIAEGNGRFSNADQARFLSTSHESAVKLAARLDLCVTQDLLPRYEVAEWKAHLERVAVMTASMIAGIQA